MKRILPNLLTILRMICALSLLFFRPLSVPFFIVYAVAGLSDLLDGFFARRFSAESQAGARLDSAADLLLCAVLLFVLIPFLQWPVWLIAWIGGIALVRLSAALVCLLRFRSLAFLHTFANKATGILLLLSPCFLPLLGLQVTGILLCAVASLSALEELLLQILSPSLDFNRSSLFRFRN